jgi:hypothetical protein
LRAASASFWAKAVLSQAETMRRCVMPAWAIVLRMKWLGSAAKRGGRVSLEGEERQPEQLNRDVVEERGELFLLPLPCGCSYAIQRL